MILVISTQNQENYGAHDWDGTGQCPSYWKFKGGQEYKVTGVPLNIDYDAVVEMVRKDIEESNDFYRVDIIGWSVESDDYLSWFEKSQLDYEGSIQHKEPEIDYSEVNSQYA
tara:strand:+ start:1142 stop:1477 length:336 start_codon:yes stop_codon:yes gene_type:complete